jgi:hypothetical protein
MVLRMKVSYSEGVANHTDLESCADAREGGGEALTEGCTGQPLSCERHEPLRKKRPHRGADALKERGRQHEARRDREMRFDPARSKTLRTCTRTMFGNREIPRLPRATGEAASGSRKDERR